MVRIFALLALPAVLALPTAPPDESALKSLFPRGYYEGSTVTNPAALKWYKSGDGSKSTNKPIVSLSLATDNSEQNQDDGDGDNSSSSSTGKITSNYQCFKTGNYPALSSWLPFDTLWQQATKIIATNNPGLSKLSSGKSLTSVLRSKIELVAKDSKVDARLILAVILQESSGKVSVQCTGDNNVNCGLLQGPPGSRAFDPTKPVASIEAMIRDGVQGHEGSWPTGGPGIAYLLGKHGQPWAALRDYNSGRVADPSDLRVTGGWGIKEYVLDVANRLVGWNGEDSAQRQKCL